MANKWADIITAVANCLLVAYIYLTIINGWGLLSWTIIVGGIGIFSVPYLHDRIEAFWRRKHAKNIRSQAN